MVLDGKSCRFSQFSRRLLGYESHKKTRIKPVLDEAQRIAIACGFHA